MARSAARRRRGAESAERHAGRPRRACACACAPAPSHRAHLAERVHQRPLCLPRRVPHVRGGSALLRHPALSAAPTETTPGSLAPRLETTNGDSVFVFSSHEPPDCPWTQGRGGHRWVEQGRAAAGGSRRAPARLRRSRRLCEPGPGRRGVWCGVPAAREIPGPVWARRWTRARVDAGAAGGAGAARGGGLSSTAQLGSGEMHRRA